MNTLRVNAVEGVNRCGTKNLYELYCTLVYTILHHVILYYVMKWLHLDCDEYASRGLGLHLLGTIAQAQEHHRGLQGVFVGQGPRPQRTYHVRMERFRSP